MSEPNLFSKHDMYTQIELLKKEVSDMKGIYQRLDTAIVKIGDVSNSMNRMLAVHEEKIQRQEQIDDLSGLSKNHPLLSISLLIILFYTKILNLYDIN